MPSESVLDPDEKSFKTTSHLVPKAPERGGFSLYPVLQIRKLSRKENVTFLKFHKQEGMLLALGVMLVSPQSLFHKQCAES